MPVFELHQKSGCSEQTCAIAQLGNNDLNFRAFVSCKDAVIKSLLQGLYKSVALGAYATTEKDNLGSKDVCDIGKSAGKVVKILFKNGGCRLVCFTIIEDGLAVHLGDIANLPHLAVGICLHGALCVSNKGGCRAV